ncbi:hypothetical protein SNE40_018835 [Patella caerulea]|uniref:Fibrinogen C-terminal domain-containing protein n=1 Tax=Patella caerulea TaxID=87958 RepID=A0AAN8P4N7_PATCE
MLWLIWSSVAILYLVESFQHATFTRIDRIFSTCDPSKTIREDVVGDTVDCAITCTEDTECRKFRYCTSGITSCTLYKDGSECMVSSGTCFCYKKNIGCNTTACTCPLGYYGPDCQQIVKDCNEASDRYTDAKALVTIQPDTAKEPFEVGCTFKPSVLTKILERTHFCGTENFNRTLAEYERGFGEGPRHRWLGFDKIMQILNLTHTEMRLKILIDTEFSKSCINWYANFSIDSSIKKYNFYGTPGDMSCGDSILGSKSLLGNAFSTYDVDYTGTNACASKFGGGWWYDNDTECTRSFLMGTMDGSGMDNFWYDLISNGTIMWVAWHLERL